MELMLGKKNFIRCPHCGEETVPKEKVLLDGWTKIGTVLACALCGGKIADLPVEQENSKQKPELENCSGLAALLGEELRQQPELRKNEDDCHFCRDCRHYIKHPFLSRCARKQTEVNPMDDCAEFEPPIAAETEEKKYDKLF